MLFARCVSILHSLVDRRSIPIGSENALLCILYTTDYLATHVNYQHDLPSSDRQACLATHIILFNIHVLRTNLSQNQLLSVALDVCLSVFTQSPVFLSLLLVVVPYQQFFLIVIITTG